MDQPSGEDLFPQAWDEYVGQERLKEELQTWIQDAKQGARPLDHVLLCAPSGVGKTSLARLIAYELGEPMVMHTMPITFSALVHLVSQHQGVIFFDELHRASTRQQEDLLPLLQFGRLISPNGGALEAGWLTIIGASTEPQDLITPLFTRFPIRPEFDEYTEEDLGRIIEYQAGLLGVVIHNMDALALAGAAAGTPRRCEQFVKAARSLAAKFGRPATAPEVLDFCRVQPDGLSAQHLRYMELLYRLVRPAGLTRVATHLQLPEPVIIELERLLLAKGYLTFEVGGRTLTPEGFRRMQPPPRRQGRAA